MTLEIVIWAGVIVWIVGTLPATFVLAKLYPRGDMRVSDYHDRVFGMVAAWPAVVIAFAIVGLFVVIIYPIERLYGAVWKSAGGEIADPKDEAWPLSSSTTQLVDENRD